MMRKALFLLLLAMVFCQIPVSAQLTQVKATQKIADKIALLISTERGTLSPSEALELDTLWKNINEYRDYQIDESALNGKTKFSLLGNESALKDLFQITAGVEVDHGTYPFELDLKVNSQTTIRDGQFAENISDIDISFDYHPKIGKGLALETFVFLSRFNNTYLGIDQRYESGGGIILNYFSSKRLTKHGEENLEKIRRIPEYKLENDVFAACYAKLCTPIGNEQRLSEAELATLRDIRFNLENDNIKENAKFRFALLLGLYYENEKARAERELLFNGIDSTFAFTDFDATNKIRWELRPTIVYQPVKDVTFRLYPYFKFPLVRQFETISFDESTFDRRPDKFYDIQTSLTAKVTANASISVVYRYFRDFAPKRRYVLDENNAPVLIIGQETSNFYNLIFSLKF